MTNRAIDRVGECVPESVSKLRHSILSVYDLEHTNVNIDTSLVAVYEKGTELFDFEYSMDKHPDLRQVNFGATELHDRINIPSHLSVNKGNTSDSIQFVKIMGDIIDDLRDDSLFVLDTGGDTKQAFDHITANNMRYITRKRLNKIDDIKISKIDKDCAYCIDECGVYCRIRTFKTSGRIVYLCSIQRNCTVTRWPL